MKDYSWNHDERICVIGSDYPNGTYMYLIKLSDDVTIPFGRFKKGKKIQLSSGYTPSRLVLRSSS